MAVFHLFQINGDHIDKLADHDNAPILDAIVATCRNASNAHMLEDYPGIKYLGHSYEPITFALDHSYVIKQYSGWVCFGNNKIAFDRYEEF